MTKSRFWGPQAGKCAHCGLYFGAEDKPEVDHIIAKARGGNDGYNNLHYHKVTTPWGSVTLILCRYHPIFTIR
ncbi:MAG: HNH endonuclease [Chloroflexi bacterium]|nr:HNH endonuclease [Chloroflexota bacterium]